MGRENKCAQVKTCIEKEALKVAPNDDKCPIDTSEQILQKHLKLSNVLMESNIYSNKKTTNLPSFLIFQRCKVLF